MILSHDDPLRSLYSKLFSSPVVYVPMNAPGEFASSHPSTILPGCNILFEMWLRTFCYKTDYRWTQSNTRLSIETTEFLKVKYARSYFFFLLQYCQAYHSPWQQFFIRLYLNWMGTNNRGTGVLQDAGLTCSRETFRIYRTRLCNQELEKTKELLNSNSTLVFWLDNYNQNYYLRSQNAHISNSINYNGTAFGVSYAEYSISTTRDAAYFTRPTLLSDECRYCEAIENSFSQLKFANMRNFKSSQSYLCKMFNAPWKPKIHGSDYAKMDYFQPLCIKSYNISSDDGIVKAFCYLDEVIAKDIPGRIFVKADVNVYYRFCKVRHIYMWYSTICQNIKSVLTYKYVF